MTAERADGQDHLPLLRRRLRRAGRRRTRTARSRSRGDPDHPANFGRLCSKGSALGETLGARRPAAAPGDRRQPARLGRGARSRRRASFARRSPSTGRTAVAFYVSGQLLTEDYYVANKLMKGFIGSANIDTNSRLCMASSVAGHAAPSAPTRCPAPTRISSRPISSCWSARTLAWCHPVLYQRLAAARAGARHEDRRHRSAPHRDRGHRRPASADRARRRRRRCSTACSPISARRGLHRPRLCRGAHHRLRRRARRRARRSTLAEIAARDRPRRRRARALLRRCSRDTRTVVTVYSARASTSRPPAPTRSTPSSTAISPTGRIGKPGMGPFSVTGQPNAMGGREVGGLANMLAAHMEFENPAHRDRVQALLARAPSSPASRASRPSTCSSAVADGRIKALWIMAHQSGRSACRTPTACARRWRACPFVVVSDVHRGHRHHALRPCPAARRRPGARRTARSPIPSGASRASAPFLRAPGEARPDWWIICEVARAHGLRRRLRLSRRPARSSREHAALSGVRE